MSESSKVFWSTLAITLMVMVVASCAAGVLYSLAMMLLLLWKTQPMILQLTGSGITIAVFVAAVRTIIHMRRRTTRENTRHVGGADSMTPTQHRWATNVSSESGTRPIGCAEWRTGSMTMKGAGCSRLHPTAQTQKKRRRLVGGLRTGFSPGHGGKGDLE